MDADILERYYILEFIRNERLSVNLQTPNENHKDVVVDYFDKEFLVATDASSDNVVVPIQNVLKVIINTDDLRRHDIILDFKNNYREHSVNLRPVFADTLIDQKIDFYTVRSEGTGYIGTVIDADFLGMLIDVHSDIPVYKNVNPQTDYDPVYVNYLDIDHFKTVKRA